ncbi:MAG: glycosyl hydrolase, partial [Pyrinomonadaceae bacterium]
MDEGQSWQPISGDLTRNDKSKQTHSGGAISGDNTSVEYYDTIFSVDESPVKQGVIWAGTDDGLVHVTENGGQTWSNVTPKDLPEWIQVNHIRASPHDAGSAYFAAANYKNDDQKPYIYKTNDYGKTWKKIVKGINPEHFTRAVTEDPNRRGFLYAGTERGIYYSNNDGEQWQSLQLNLPIVPITDLTVHKREKDLVVATQGRSFYVLDNLPVLYQLADAEKSSALLFKPEDAYRTAGGGGFGLGPNATVGRNPPNGAVVNYYLKDVPKKDLTIEFLDSTNAVIRKFTRRMESSGGGAPGEPQPAAELGFNTFVWNYRLPNATTIQNLIMWGGSLAGPRIPPGNYSTRLTVDGKVVGTESIVVKADLRLTTTQDDFAKQFDLMKKINVKLTETHTAINELRDLRTQIDSLSRRLKPENKDLIDKAKDIVTKLTAVEETLHQTKIRSGQDALNFPIRLNNKLAALSSFVDSADYGPTASAYVVYTDLTTKIDAELAKYAAIKSQDVVDFNKQYAAKGLPIIISG